MMYSKNLSYVFVAIRLILLAGVNVAFFAGGANKDLPFFLALAFFNVITLLSFADILKAARDAKRNFPVKVAPIIISIIYCFAVAVISILMALIPNIIQLGTVLFVYLPLLIVYIGFIGLLFILGRTSAKIEQTNQGQTGYFKLLKKNLISLQGRFSYSEEVGKAFEKVIDFVTYRMSALTGPNLATYEQQAARCLSVLEECLEQGDNANAKLTLEEMLKILEKREMEA